MTSENYRPAERRPLASRQLSIADRCATWLAARNISPNAISLAGVGFSIVACLCLAGTAWTNGINARALFVLAALFIQARLLANLFDGMVAVQSGKASPRGEIFNEVPDRISDPLIFIGTGFAAGGLPSLGFLCAVLALFVAYLRVFGNSLGATDLFLGPMAKPQRMATLTVACLYSALAPYGWFAGPGSHASTGAATLALSLIVLGTLVTAVRRLGKISAQIQDRA